MPEQEPLTPRASGVNESLVIRAAPTRVFAAFFDPAALAIWWQVIRSVTVPRPMGVYAVEWEATSQRDEIFGRLGGVFHGRVLDVRGGVEFFVADAWWLPPEGNPLGPMGLHVTCAAEGGGCRVRVQQQGGEDGPRWQRYYGIIGPGWRSSLETLRHCLEHGTLDPDR
ncbi:MAG TPA: SRPBCC domain-containing protein [Vicinamibacterales bacterium]|nr:SRPBCC domain-containing protein [Vicinamibacterales bacterium]